MYLKDKKAASANLEKISSWPSIDISDTICLNHWKRLYSFMIFLFPLNTFKCGHGLILAFPGLTLGQKLC